MEDTKFDGLLLRKVAGAFPTGVAVVTVEKKNGQIHGTTINSFVSVSLDPALVSFCIKEEASIYPMLKEEQTIGISILKSHQKVISNQFAGFNKKDVVVNMTKTKTDAFVIDDCLAWYSTKIRQILPAGDHYWVLCEVQELHRAKEGKPLVYFSGYRTTGKVV